MPSEYNTLGSPRTSEIQELKTNRARTGSKGAGMGKTTPWGRYLPKLSIFVNTSILMQINIKVRGSGDGEEKASKILRWEKGRGEDASLGLKG